MKTLRQLRELFYVPVITAGVVDLRLQGFVTLIRLLFDYNL